MISLRSIFRTVQPAAHSATLIASITVSASLSAAALITSLALSASLSACSGFLPTPTPTPSPLPTATETVTPTIVWFPLTNTPTPSPAGTLTPTPDTRPGLGEVLFIDYFDQPEQWNLTVSARASAAVERNRLTLALGEGKPSIYLFSLRAEPVLGDFYAEITVSLNLCRGDDQYGLLFRVNSPFNLYRFSLACNGRMRLDKMLDGKVYPLQDWLPSGDAPLGSPAEIKLGIWAVNGEMRFFLNDRYQFTAFDRHLKRGTLGVFAQSSGDTAVTASFSDLTVYAVSYSSPTPSPTPSSTPKPSRTPTATP